MTKEQCDVIIQARLSSERLPGKVLKKLCGKSVLSHIISRLKQCNNINRIIVATSDHAEDEEVYNEAEKNGVLSYRGSLDNVLNRFCSASIHFKCKNVVRVCADSPVIDYKIVDNVISYYKNNDYDIVKTKGFPIGTGIEVFSFFALMEAEEKATEQYQFEHVTPFIYENFKTGIYKSNVKYDNYRLTLDTVEDFRLIEEIYNNFYEKSSMLFGLDDIVSFLSENDDLVNINKHVVQKSVK